MPRERAKRKELNDFMNAVWVIDALLIVGWLYIVVSAIYKCKSGG